MFYYTIRISNVKQKSPHTIVWGLVGSWRKARTFNLEINSFALFLLRYPGPSNKLYQENSQSQATFKIIVTAITTTNPKIMSTNFFWSFIILLLIFCVSVKSVGKNHKSRSPKSYKDSKSFSVCL